MPPPRILVADDEPDVLEALKLLLKGEGYDVQAVTSPRALLSTVEAHDFDALLIDMNYTRDTTSGAEGLDLLARLQGLVKGAFTDAKGDRVGRFELADGGTLFLDEIANLPLSQQAKLLRVLETGEFERVGASKTQRVNVRVISATNADIHADATAGKFRQDLLFRLNTVELRLPPLRERREDVPLLGTHFLGRYATRYRKPITGFAPDAMEALLKHPWPGNVRELDHTIERAVLMAEATVVRSRDLGLDAGVDGAASLDQMSLEEVERVLIQKALGRAAGNVSEAAKALGLSRSALYRRIKRHGL